MIHLEFDNQSEYEGIARVVVATFLLKYDPTIEEMADVKTAVSEAVTNAIVHGYPNEKGKVVMKIYEEQSYVCVDVMDQGVGIENIKKAMEPLFTTKPEAERTGMGFSFMEAFMDEVKVESELGCGTKVHMKKKVVKK